LRVTGNGDPATAVNAPVGPMEYAATAEEISETNRYWPSGDTSASTGKSPVRKGEPGTSVSVSPAMLKT